MAKKTNTSTKPPRKPRFQKTKSFFGNRQTQTIIGAFIALFGIFLAASFVSYLFNWQYDQSQLANFSDKDVTVKNLLGKLGASLSHLIIYNGFGIASLYVPFLLFFSGSLLFLKGSLLRIRKFWGWGLLGMIWLSISLAFFAQKNLLLAGIVGYELNIYLQQFLGKTGLLLSLFFLLLSYLVIRFKLTPERVHESLKSKSKELQNEEAIISSENTTALVCTSESFLVVEVFIRSSASKMEEASTV